MADSSESVNETEDELLLLFESSDDSEMELSAHEQSDFEPSDSEDASEEGPTVTDLKALKGIDWRDEVQNELLTSDKEFAFNTGPAHDLPVGSTPLQFFKLFFSDDICEVVQMNINKYAEREQSRKKTVDVQWKPIESTMEMWRFFCVILICGIVQVPQLKDYWSSSDILGNEAVKKLMSQKRFQKILQYFHIAVADGSLKFTHAVEPIIDDIRERFLNHFKPPRELLMEEGSLRDKKVLNILQSTPLNSSNSGFKVWTLSSPGGYIFNFDIYAGRRDKKARCKNGLTLGHNVAKRLLMPINSRGHHIYLDRFFTSVPLMLDIFNGGNRACGPIKMDRKCLPKEFKTLKLKQPGDHKHFQCVQCPDLLCCVWYDEEHHCVLSTNSKMELNTYKCKRGLHYLTIHCPSIISNYNAYMGGLKRPQPTPCAGNNLGIPSKWWRYLFLYLFDSSLNNAFIVYNLTNMPEKKQPKTFMDFKLDVIEEISECVLGNSLQHRSINSRSLTPALSEQRPSTSSLPTIVHQKIKIKGRKQICKRCSKLKLKTVSNYYVQSSFMCNVCQICLCRSCFGVYHSEKKMEFS